MTAAADTTETVDPAVEAAARVLYANHVKDFSVYVDFPAWEQLGGATHAYWMELALRTVAAFARLVLATTAEPRGYLAALVVTAEQEGDDG